MGQGLHIFTRTLTTKTLFRSPVLFKHDAVLMWASWGSWMADLLQISSMKVRSRTFQAHNPRHWRSHVQNKQDNNHSFRVVANQYRLAYFFGWLVLTLNIVIKVILICLICLSMWVNIMMLAVKSGPQIAVKTGNPTGLLCRQIWYSVWKSGVLGITEYRQGRPLIYVGVLILCPNLFTDLQGLMNFFT